MAVKWAISSGNWSNAANWNGGTKPVAGDDVYTNTFTVNVDENIDVASLNSSARARDIATATMTSNNSPVPYVAAASTEAGAGNEAYRAFNKTYPTNLDYWTATTTTGWLSYDFSVGTVIDGYTIYGINLQANNPRNWTLEGSNDNISWTTLHTVTLPAAIVASGNYSINTIGNSTSYRYYRVNVTLSGGGVLAIRELELYTPTTSVIAAGGTFNFNTAGVTASVTGLTPLAFGAAGLLTFSHATGSNTITLTNNSTVSALIPNISHSGNGDLTFTCPNISANAFLSGHSYISKTGGGTLTLNANCTLVQSSGQANLFLLNSSNGNVIINGNVQLTSTGLNNPSAYTINQNVGTLTINGNISPSSIYFSGLRTINFSGTLLTINGNVLSGVGNGILSTGAIVVNGNVGGAYNAAAIAINTSANVTVTGNIYGANTAPIYSTSAISVTVTGDVYASYIAIGIYLTAGASVVNLTGNMYNVNGVQAIFAPTILVSPSATTQWTLQQLGVKDKVFYSSDTTPGNPIAANVRNGVTYGPGLGTTGTMIVPAASDVRMGVAVDNTTGTGELTAADFLAAIQVSADPIAERLRNISTVDSTGNIIKNYNT